jgi:hypothetical protein
VLQTVRNYFDTDNIPAALGRVGFELIIFASEIFGERKFWLEY